MSTEVGRDFRADSDAVSRRDGATSGLIYKTRVRQPRDRELAAPAPPIAPGEQVAWWQWVDTRIAHDIETLVDTLYEAIGQVIATERRSARAEVDLLRRQLAQLRAEFDADRGLKALQAEVAAARADVPKLPDVEARFAAKHAEARREIASLKKELEATRARLTLVHTELGTVRYQFEKKSPKPVVTVSFNTPESSFVVQDDDPAASEAWRRFAENSVRR